jgi:hypothetical protein
MGWGHCWGVAPGGNRGPASESLADLEKFVADDNVHFTELGYKNLGTAILQAISGIKDGSLTKSIQPQKSSSTGAGSGTQPGKSCFFWRGFSSPVGYSGSRVPHHQPQQQTNQGQSNPHRSWTGGRGCRGGGATGGSRGRGHYQGQKGHWCHPYKRW